MRYRAGPAADYVWVPLDALTAVYHRPAGATHLLAEPASELLAALIEAPADVAVLAARFGIVDNARDALDARLSELVEAGLVRSA